MADTTGAAAGAKAGAKPMNPTVRMIATILSLFTKYGPGIVSELGSVFSIFNSAATTPAAGAATQPGVVNFVSDLQAVKADSGSLSADHVAQLADKHGLDLTDTDVAEVHKLAA